MTALLVGAGAFLVAMSVRRVPVGARILPYLAVEPDAIPGRSRRLDPAPIAGLAVGGALGTVVLPGPWFAAMALGAGAGVTVLGVSARRSRLRRRRRLGFELPAMAELLALYSMSGDSVLGAIRHVCSETSGVTTQELSESMRSVDDGSALSEALQAAAQTSIHPDAARLYRLLSEAHRSGARLVDALEIYAADRRSALDRDIVEEGGRRALTGYGPILGLMIPTTLVFLMYPTLAGLDSLSGTP